MAVGVGGHMLPIPSPTHHDLHAPYMKPPFTLGQLKRAIPPHCFNRSLPHSLFYLVKDLSLSFTLFFIATTYFSILPYPLQFLAWSAYWALQSITFTGIWVIAHECGHHAFSDYQWVDDTLGIILHSFLFVPYFSWKYSHRRHHSNTGSLERDEVFVPKPRSHLPRYWRYMNNPLGRALFLVVCLTLGWPLYLAFNVSGREYNRLASHFDPHGPIYSSRERVQIYISDVGIMGMGYLVYLVGCGKGVWWVMGVYGVPLLMTNAFLVTITYLQHTHPELPHYDSTEWEWLRGALSTVDRDFGLILNKAFHNITDTHIAHHLFSTMPHYHAEEATTALKPLLGKYYRFDPTPAWEALWREAKHCLFVEPDSTHKGVFWYTNQL